MNVRLDGDVAQELARQELFGSRLVAEVNDILRRALVTGPKPILPLRPKVITMPDGERIEVMARPVVDWPEDPEE